MKRHAPIEFKTNDGRSVVIREMDEYKAFMNLAYQEAGA